MKKLNINSAIALSEGTCALQLSQLRVLLGCCDMEAATVSNMLNLAKQSYVNSHHTRKIFPIQPCKAWKNGGYRTYVYEGSKRKELTAATKDGIMEKIYAFYMEADNKPKTLGSVFNLLMDYKRNCRNRKEKTISIDKSMFKHVSDELRETNISQIDDERIQTFIVSDLLPKKPTQNLLKRFLELLNQIFEYGIRKKLCIDNPMRYITAEDYYMHCNQSFKAPEEKAFSLEELDRLNKDAETKLNNPRILISLLAEETGERVGELLAIHKEDVDLINGFIHIHRQQVKENNKYVEVPYTKNEKNRPRGGRKIPLTDRAKYIIELALSIPGESVYLFHDPNSSEWIKKDGYLQNLRRRCIKLGCVPTNNHAFRMAYNKRLEDLDLKDTERALIMGHDVQTNVRKYTLTDNRRLREIKDKIKEEP